MAKKTKKRAMAYDPKLNLKDSVQWDDLIALSLKQPEKKQAPKAKRAKGKKK